MLGLWPGSAAGRSESASGRIRLQAGDGWVGWLLQTIWRTGSVCGHAGGGARVGSSVGEGSQACCRAVVGGVDGFGLCISPLGGRIMDLGRCSLNSITVRSVPLPELVQMLGERGIPAIAPWREQLHATGVTRAGTIIRGANLRVSSLCRAGMFTSTTASERRRVVDDNLRAIDEAHSIGAAVLTIVPGPVVDRDPDRSRGMIREGIEAIVPYATSAGVKLGLEPMHPMMATSRSAIMSLAEANDIADVIQSPTLAVVIDAYHVWWDYRVKQEIARAGARIGGFQVSDWVTPIRSELSSRGMMGDGCIDLPALCADVEAAGYRGDVEVEILSDDWWARPPAEVLDVVCARFSVVL